MPVLADMSPFGLSIVGVLFDLIFKINIVLPQNYLIMKKVFFLLLAVWMSAATFGQSSDLETITLMSCVQCDDYFELEIGVDEMVKLVLSCNTVSETNDSFGIRAQFYEEFPEETLPGVTGIFLNSQDNFDTLSIVIRKDLTGETRAMYLLTKFGWLQSVDMQEFNAFDESLWLSKYGDYDQFYRTILRRNELLR